MLLEPTLYVSLLLIVAMLLLALNFACWLVFRWLPTLLLSENERLKLDYLSRFEGEFKGYIPEWLDIAADDWPDFVREYRKGETGSHIYDDFVEFRHPVCTGHFFNMHPAGFRHVRDQGPWPISPAFYNIFFFGGSTTLNVGPDWTSIPSYLQEEFKRQQVIDKPIRVYNFGRGSYFSTQERILLQQLLLAKTIPDMALFLDGVNDFYFFHGRPATYGFFQHALDAHNRENYEAVKNRTAAKPKWQKLKEFMLSLPLVRAIEAIGERFAKLSATPAEVLYRPTPIEREALLQSMDRYFENKRQIVAICRDRGISPVFVWQPTPAYKYDLTYHVALSRHYGLGGHERSGEGYALVEEKRKTDLAGDDSFIWLADIQQDERRPLYLDSVHYTSAFSRIIARHIADALIQRNLITKAASGKIKNGITPR